MIHLYIMIGIVVILGYFGIKYLDGNFTIVSDEIIEKGDIRSVSSNTITGQYYNIKRTYQSGRIKIIRKRL